MLTYLGCPVEREGTTVGVTGPRELEARPITIPGDFSSAAFLLAAAVLLPDSVVTIENVNLNPTRTGFLEVLRRMGAQVEIANIREVCGEPVGDITARSSSLQGCEIGGDLIPWIIDELPWWPCWAVRPRKTLVTMELRVKESDRIHTTAMELGKLGLKMETFPMGSGCRAARCCGASAAVAMTIGSP